VNRYFLFSPAPPLSRNRARRDWRCYALRRRWLLVLPTVPTSPGGAAPSASFPRRRRPLAPRLLPLLLHPPTLTLVCKKEKFVFLKDGQRRRLADAIWLCPASNAAAPWKIAVTIPPRCARPACTRPSSSRQRKEKEREKDMWAQWLRATIEIYPHTPLTCSWDQLSSQTPLLVSSNYIWSRLHLEFRSGAAPSQTPP
jgi:hypothetical protein